MTSRNYILAAILLLLPLAGTTAQVTIGSDLSPNKGALLDIKEYEPDANNTTARRGLILPRVNLTDLNSLKDIPDANQNDKVAYTGLVVYNAREYKVNAGCSFTTIPASTYVWTGENWINLSGKGGSTSSGSDNIDPNNIEAQGVDGNAIWVLEKNGKLTICGQGPMNNYTATTGQGTAPPWSVYQSKAKSLEIREGITRVGNGAFFHMKELSGSLVIPNTVTSIGKAAFRDTKFNGQLTLSDKLKTIEEQAFDDVQFTGTLRIPNTTTSIESQAFSGTGFNGKLIFPSSMTKITNASFAMMENIIEIVIPNSVTIIENQAFWRQINLTSLTISDNITSIGKEAFSGTQSLKTISLPSTLTYFGEKVLTYSGVETIYTAAPRSAFQHVNSFASEGGTMAPDEQMKWNKNRKLYILAPANKQDYLNDSAFWQKANVTIMP